MKSLKCKVKKQEAILQNSDFNLIMLMFICYILVPKIYIYFCASPTLISIPRSHKKPKLHFFKFKTLFLTIYICLSKVHTSLLPTSLLTVDVITYFVSLMGIKWYFTLTLTCISVTKNAFQHLFTFEFAFEFAVHSDLL